MDMTRLAFGLIAVAFVASASQAGPLGFLKNLRQRPQGNTQAPAQAAAPAPAQPAPVATSEAAPAANPALNRLTNNRVTRYFTKPAANPN
jgi:predicted lipid-binding transport protein (Tim44 family)